jgi:hypothetical protein
MSRQYLYVITNTRQASLRKADATNKNFENILYNVGVLSYRRSALTQEKPKLGLACISIP